MIKIITISREYGSGGRLIGKKTAESLGWKFYDKEIIEAAAKESGLYRAKRRICFRYNQSAF